MPESPSCEHQAHSNNRQESPLLTSDQRFANDQGGDRKRKILLCVLAPKGSDRQWYLQTPGSYFAQARSPRRSSNSFLSHGSGKIPFSSAVANPWFMPY